MRGNGKFTCWVHWDNMYGVLTAAQVATFSSVYRTHLLLLLLQKSPWSEVFNEGGRPPWDIF